MEFPGQGGDAAETLQERQENELKALRAIFMGDFQDLRKKDKRKGQGKGPPEVVLILTPQESMSGKKDIHTAVHLHVKCGVAYPNEVPDVYLLNPKGLSNKIIEELKGELMLLAEKLKGEVMIHELALHVQKFLHKHNQPRFESFYDEMLSNQKKQEEQVAQEMQRLREMQKQKEEKQRKAIESEILKKQEAMKEEARQNRENKQLIKSASPDLTDSASYRWMPSSPTSTHPSRRERSQSVDTTIMLRRITSTPKRRRQNTLKSDDNTEGNACEHSGIVKIIFKTKEERMIHRGKCLGHSNRGNVTFVGMDNSSGELIILEEWIIKCSTYVNKQPLLDENAEAILKQVICVEQELGSLLRLANSDLIHYLGIQHSVEHDKIIIQILQEHSPGQNLSHYLATGNPVAIDQLHHYTLGIVKALTYLHQNSVVHKDLRDSCIFIENFHKVRIADYSIGKRMTELVSNANKEVVKEIFPPSLGRGAKKSDVYRLGLLILSLSKGSYVTETIPEIPSSLPVDLQDFLRKCLLKNEQDRWSMQQLCDHTFLKPSIHNQLNPQKALDDQLLNQKEEAPEAQAIPFIIPAENCQSRLQNEFQILKWLGKGAFGDVLKAKNQLDGRIYAIKRIVLNQHNKQLNRKITREVKLLSKLNHENIVRYYYSWIESVCVSPQDTSSSETISFQSPKGSQIDKSNITGPSTTEDELERLAPPCVDVSDWSSISFDLNSNLQAQESSTSSDEEEEEENFSLSLYFENSPNSSGGIVFENDKNDNISRDENKESVGQTKDVSLPEGPKLVQFMYIQMEFCEKSTLRNAIDMDLRADDSRMWRLFREIVEGLAHIHQQGIIHRDLKPVNIFLDFNDHVKIGDFGLATTDIIARRNLIEPTNTTIMETKSNLSRDVSQSDALDDGILTGRVGTALYVSPELNNSSTKSYTQKVDIYSLGIIFFEMCYHPLKTAMERVSVLNSLRLPEIVLPSEFEDDLMSRQKYIILWLLNHDPSRRPTSNELLQSDYLPPPQMEEAELQEMLRHTINNPQSKLYKHMISTLLKQEMDEAAEYVYDMDIHKGSFNSRASLVHKYVRDNLTKIFQKHGAMNVITPLLVPKSDDYEQGDQCVAVMDHSGGVVMLPYELRVSFARFVVRNNISNLKRYCISRTYRERKIFGCHPRELFECAFDIVTPTAGNFVADAEVLTVVWDVISEFPALQSRSYDFRINHMSLIKAIMFHSGIPEEKHNDVIAIIGDTKNDNMDKYFIDNQLSNLNLSDSTIGTLQTFLKIEGSINKMATLLKPILKQSRQISSLLKQGLYELELIINNAEALGLKSKIIVTTGLVNTTQQFSGLFFQVVCEVKKKRRKTCNDILASGGRYDALLNSMRIPANSNIIKEGTQSAVGVSISLEKIISAELEEESFKPPSAYDVLVCSVGQKPMLKEKNNIIRDLWSAGIRASLHHDSSQSLEEIQDFCRDIGVNYMTILKDVEQGSVRVRILEKDRFSEKKLNSAELCDYLQKSKQDSSDNSSTLNKSDGGKMYSGNEQIPSNPNNFTITFVTQIKLALNTKRRYEAQISSHVAPVLQHLSNKVCIEIIAVELDGQVLRNIASHIQLDGTEEDFEGSLQVIIENNTRHKKYLSRIFDDVHELKFQKKCPVLLLYGLKDNIYKLLL